jgi:adenosylhomocysteine nucleosidase
MIVVTFALPAESSAFIRSLKNVKRDGAVVRGDLEPSASNIEHRTSNIHVLHTGVGAKECENRLQGFLRREKPRLLIASGFCGGTKDQLHPGNLVIADNASELSKKARAILPGAMVGKIHSADRIIDPAADRYEIGRKHGAIAIDMETETIARICAEKSVPMLTLRVVSDSAAAPFPAPPNVLFDSEKQRAKFLPLFSYIMQNPLSTINLVRFARQIAHAKGKLAAALCAVIPAL